MKYIELLFNIRSIFNTFRLVSKPVPRPDRTSSPVFHSQPALCMSPSAPAKKPVKRTVYETKKTACQVSNFFIYLKREMTIKVLVIKD